MLNQKAKRDAGKLRLSLVPREIIREIAKVREYGVNKYPDGGYDNWKQVEVERYRDAAFRHFLAYLDDPYGVDSESGLKHLAHLATNIAFLCELEKHPAETRDIGLADPEIIFCDIREAKKDCSMLNITRTSTPSQSIENLGSMD